MIPDTRGTSARAPASKGIVEKINADTRIVIENDRDSSESNLRAKAMPRSPASGLDERIVVPGLVANHIKRFDHTICVCLRDAFTSVSRRLELADVGAEFFPYSELKHTWKRNGGSLSFKISDYMLDAPEEVLESLAWYLLCRAMGRECPRIRATRYLDYARSRELWEPKKDLYMRRSRSLTFVPQGAARDLREVFDYVNTFYFSGKVQSPILAWASESPRRRLGFYLAPLNLLAANTVMDSERVPRYVLEFVVFHELLHQVNAGDGRGIRRVRHDAEFRNQERAFSHYDDAERWLAKLVRERRPLKT